ncbi:MAG TPA: phosphoesterase [Eubacteriaceae bacterium]|nr:phosphoesterase [Eubacteriaceae bacterium]
MYIIYKWCFFHAKERRRGRSRLFVDAHTHLEQIGDDFAIFADKARKKDVFLLSCSTDPVSYIQTKQKIRTEGLKNAVVAFGIHPWKAHRHYHRLDRYENWILEAPMIGEIGLDFHWVKNRKKYEYQMEVFQKMIQRAVIDQKPINVHTKGAEREVETILRNFQVERPIIHWYSGDKESFNGMLKHGCIFTIGIDVFFSRKTREMVRQLPVYRILTETDGPEAVRWLGGRHESICYIPAIVKEIATLKRWNPLELKEIIWNNYCNLWKGE